MVDRARSTTFSHGLRVLADLNQFDGAAASEVAVRVGLHRIIVHRLLATLVSDGFIRREGRPARYFLCPGVQALADGFVAEAWITDIARPRIMDLGRNLLWPLSLAVNTGGEMRVRVATDPESTLTRRKIPLGFRLPVLGSASGLVFLAFSDAKAQRSLMDLAVQEKEQRLPPSLPMRLNRARVDGYAVWDSPEKVSQISVPVLVRRRPVASLTVRYFSSALRPAQAVAQLIPPLKICADDIGRAVADAVR